MRRPAGACGQQKPSCIKSGSFSSLLRWRSLCNLLATSPADRIGRRTFVSLCRFCAKMVQPASAELAKSRAIRSQRKMPRPPIKAPFRLNQKGHRHVLLVTTNRPTVCEYGLGSFPEQSQVKNLYTDLTHALWWYSLSPQPGYDGNGPSPPGGLIVNPWPPPLAAALRAKGRDGTFQQIMGPFPRRVPESSREFQEPYRLRRVRGA
jgi:hypothetical protein